MLQHAPIKILLVSGLLSVCSLFGTAQVQASETTWPNVSGADIGGGLETEYEPSGNVLFQGKLYVVTDEGEVTRMDTSGKVDFQTATQPTTLRSQSTALGLGSDLEAITTGNDSFLYLGYEGTNMMAQLDPNNLTLTGKTWSFNPTLGTAIGTDLSNGMEALTITPSYVITGIQHNGQLYYFEVNFSVGGSTPTPVGTVNLASLAEDTTLNADISDLYYSADTQKLYALYDSANKIVELNETGTMAYSDFSLPSGNDQEGLSLSSNCSSSSTATVYISEDTNGADHQVWGYDSAYPVTCAVITPSVIDADGDGVASALDCNDSDPAVSTNQTYYLDADGDGMGSSQTVTSCSASAPTGSVSNSNESSDANDLIPNAGIEIDSDLRDNDDDGKIDEYNSVVLNGMHPYYSSFDPTDFSLATSSIQAVSGASNGAIIVRFADDSVYRYKIFSINTSRFTKVKFYNTTGYLLVTSPNGKKVLVNPYTGLIVSTLSGR